MGAKPESLPLPFPLPFLPSIPSLPASPFPSLRFPSFCLPSLSLEVFFFFASQLLPEHRPPTILRHSARSCALLSASLQLSFMLPAPQLSSSMCSLVFLCLDNLEGSISELFTRAAIATCPSVRLSVCPSRAGIVSKRRKLAA